MEKKQRTAADWIWIFVGLGGVACLALAAYLFLFGSGERSPEEMAQARREQAEKLWSEGESKAAAGDAVGAAEDLRSALSALDPRTPGYLDRMLSYAEVLEKADKAEGAETVCRQALGLNPLHFRTHLVYAGLLERLDRNRDAFYRYRAALALHPDPVPEHLPLKLTELRARVDISAEREAILSALRANPAHPSAFSGLLLLCLAETGVEDDADPDEGLRAALARAGAEVGELPAFLARAESAAADRPESVVDRAGLGNVLLLCGEYRRAAEVFGEALEISESDPASVNGAALADLLSGAEEGTRIEAAVARQPRNLLAGLARGAFHLRSGKNDKKEALQALWVCPIMSPHLPEVYRLLAPAFAAAGREEDQQAALRAYRRLTE